MISSNGYTIDIVKFEASPQNLRSSKKAGNTIYGNNFTKKRFLPTALANYTSNSPKVVKKNDNADIRYTADYYCSDHGATVASSIQLTNYDLIREPRLTAAPKVKITK